MIIIGLPIKCSQKFPYSLVFPYYTRFKVQTWHLVIKFFFFKKKENYKIILLIVVAIVIGVEI